MVLFIINTVYLIIIVLMVNTLMKRERGTWAWCFCFGIHQVLSTPV